MTRSQTIDAAETALLVARRHAAMARHCPEAAEATRRYLLDASRLFTAAGLSHRADTVARYAYRLRPRGEQATVTLTDALLEWRFGPRPEQTEGGAE